MITPRISRDARVGARRGCQPPNQPATCIRPRETPRGAAARRPPRRSCGPPRSFRHHQYPLPLVASGLGRHLCRQTRPRHWQGRWRRATRRLSCAHSAGGPERTPEQPPRQSHSEAALELLAAVERRTQRSQRGVPLIDISAVLSVPPGREDFYGLPAYASFCIASGCCL